MRRIMAVLNFDENENLWTSVDAPPLFNPSASLGQIILRALKMHGSRVAQVIFDKLNFETFPGRLFSDNFWLHDID